MKINKALRQFVATLMTIIMIVTVIPFVPVALGVTSQEDSENFAYAASAEKLAVPFHITATGGACQVGIQKSNDVSPEVKFKYAKTTGNTAPASDSYTSTYVSITTAVMIDLADGESVYFIADGGNNTLGKIVDQVKRYNKVVVSGNGNIIAAGNIMSLLYEDFSDKLTLVSQNSYAFVNLFVDCTKLVYAGDLLLPATTLSQGCYEGLFWYCINVTKIPELPATTLVTDCYKSMFYYCQSISEIRVSFKQWSDATKNWVEYIGQEGTFYGPEELPEVEAGPGNYFKGIPFNFMKQDVVNPVAVSSAGCYIAFDSEKAYVQGLDKTPSDVVVKCNDGKGEALDAGNIEINSNVISFTYGKDIYEITFLVGSKAYTMHANCKTVDACTTVDTSALDTAVTKALDCIGKEFVDGKTFNVVTTETTGYADGVIANQAQKSALSDLVGGCYNTQTSTLNDYTDQFEVDTDAIAVDSATRNFTSSYDAQIVIGYEGEQVKLNDAASIVSASIKSQTQFIENILKVVASAELNGVNVEKTYYVATDARSQAEAEEAVAAELARNSKPSKPQSSGDSENNKPAGSGIGDFVKITADAGKMTITPNPGVTVERVAFICSPSGWLPLKLAPFTGATTFDVVYNNQRNDVKLLIKTGNETKIFDTCGIEGNENIDVNAGEFTNPAVIEFSAAVGIYSRGSSPTYIAYAKGDYTEKTLADALTDESGDSPTTKVYYVKDGSTLDRSTFESGVYTFFFGDAYKVKVQF